MCMMLEYLSDAWSVHTSGFPLTFLSPFREVQQMRLIFGKLFLHSFSSLHLYSQHL